MWRSLVIASLLFPGSCDGDKMPNQWLNLESVSSNTGWIAQPSDGPDLVQAMEDYKEETSEFVLVFGGSGTIIYDVADVTITGLDIGTGFDFAMRAGSNDSGNTLNIRYLINSVVQATESVSLVNGGAGGHQTIEQVITFSFTGASISSADLNSLQIQFDNVFVAGQVGIGALKFFLVYNERPGTEKTIFPSITLEKAQD